MTAGGEKMSGPLLVLLGLTAAVGAVPAKTTRYWDCCKPSCAWDSNANKGGVMRVDAPVHSCGLDGAPLADGDAKNICAGGGSNSGPAYMCTNQLPFEVTADVAYGYAAANLECSVCYELAFESSTVLAGKRMVVQVVNSGDDLGAVHFDLQIPGGGFGIFNGCTGQSVNGPGQFSSTTEAQWGKRYGGVNSLSECGNLPSELQAGCNFRFGWFKNADNPGAQATRVKCPDSLVAASGSRRLDDDQFPDPAGNGAPVPPTPMLPPPSGPAPVPPTTCPGASSNCDCGWTNNGANCGSDDGSECFCRCCCPTKNSCNWQNGGGGGGGGGGAGGGSNCAMPAGVPSDPPAKNNRNFIDCHGKLTLGGPSGLQLVDESGAAVQLMGMSSHGLHWFPNCYTKEAIQHLTENWGINLFRAAMYVGEGGYASNPSVKQTVKDIVQWCKELGIYVMIDWHMLNPGNPNDGTYSGAQAFFEEMATLYKNEKHVLYELANEPNGVQWPAVKSYHNKIIAAIRRIDTETIIICGTPTWSQEIDKAATDPVDQPRNVMYTFHFYAGSHQGLLANVETYASQIPIFVTEWGTSMASGDGGPYLPETKKFLDTFNSAGSLGISISWAQWSYADKNEVSAALNPGACSSKSWDDTSCSGTFLKNYIKANAPTCGNTPSVTSAPDTTVPATDVPKTSAPSTDAPATAVPKTSVPKTDAPETDAPATDAPRTSAPETDAPETMAPKTNAPATDAPATKPGQTRAPATDAPATDAPKTNAPTTDAPETMAPKTNAPATDAPATKSGQTRAPATDAPATDAPKTNAPETDAPETIAPKTNAPATGAPDTDAPVRTDAPATDAPSTQCKMYDACLNNPDCCPSGTQCFKNNYWYAQCLTKCPKGWDCDVLSGGVPPPAPTLPTHGLCSKTIKKHGACTAAPYCCEGSLTCFEQSGWYAQCLDVCPGDGWSCRDLGKTPRDPRGLGAATGTAPRCNCPSWQKADTYCSSMQGGGDQCQDIPQSGVCDPSTEYKCFGTSAAAEEARQLMTFVLSNGVANFNRATFEQMVKDGLEDSAATILVKYLCPASECPFGNCADPFGAASKCIDVYDLSGRAGAVLGGEDGGAVVGVEVQSEKKQNLYGAFDKKELDGVVSMNEWWVEGGYDAGSKGKKDNSSSSSSSSNLAAIIGGTLGGLLCMGGLVAAAMLVRAKGRKAEEEVPMSMQELEDQKALRSTTANAVEFHSI